MKPNIHYKLSAKEVLDLLKTHQDGLTDSEAKTRLDKFGFNKLPERKKANSLIILFHQFKSILVYILLIAALISLFLGEVVDAGVILLAVFINVFVGFLQENKAESALFALKRIVTHKAIVLRSGRKKLIDVSELVAGDIICLENGSRVPADCRLLKSRELRVNESPLTGESMPIEKSIAVIKADKPLAERKNMVYFGTVITAGQARAVVCRTGANTEMGKIAGLISKTEKEKTPLQRKLDYFSQYLGIVVVVICSALFLLGVFLGVGWTEMFLMVVAVAVSAIPEGLLIAVTVILAFGMQKILKKGGLVRRLLAAETLGSTSVICIDKTGTLTEGEMRVKEIVTADDVFNLFDDLSKKKGGQEFYKALEIGMLCNNASLENPDESLENWKILGTPTEKALLLAGIKMGLLSRNLDKKYPRVDEIPFSSSKKFMATLHRQDANNLLLLFKGAPEKILNNTSYILTQRGVKKLQSVRLKKLLDKHENLSKNGYRVLACAYKEVASSKRLFREIIDYNEKLIFVGFYVIEDPLRADAKKVLESAKNAGIKTVLITGDHSLTAKKIGLEIGLPVEGEAIIEGQRLADMSDQDLENSIEKISIYARANPEDKLRIVSAWQKKGAIVAMTGDGVNDAPAIKRADIGIAFGSGTDVAHETADLVLLDDSFKTILAAIEQGRVIYDNIKKVILYLLSDSFTEIVLVSVGLIIGFISGDFPLPILATQILWINMIDDSFPNIALSFDPKEKEIMREGPQEKHKSILSRERKLLIVLISIVTAVSNLLLFYVFWSKTKDVDLARTIVFTTLAIDSLLYVFSCRSLRHSIFHKEFYANKFLLLAVAFGLFMQVLAVYLPFFQKIFKTVPLVWEEWIIIAMVCLAVIFIIEITKYIFVIRRK